MATKKAPSKTKKAPSKQAGSKSAPRNVATKAGRKSAGDADNYTDPALREKIKKSVTEGDKGGKPGQWSARKAQLVATEYKAEGGEYKHPRNEAQQSLKDWGDERWHTSDGKPAIREDATTRYLPDKAWEELTPAEKKATNSKKEKASKTGKQFVPNTAKAKTARKKATTKEA